MWPCSLKIIRDCNSYVHFVHCCCSVPKSCPTLFYPMDCCSPGFPVLHSLPEFVQTHVHWVSEAILPSYPLSTPSPLAHNLSQHQGVFQWVSYSHQVAKVLEFQLQHQSFQWIIELIFFMTDWFNSLLSKGRWRVFSNTTIWKHQFFGAQPSLWSSSHICTWLLENL